MLNQPIYNFHISIRAEREREIELEGARGKFVDIIKQYVFKYSLN